MRISLETPDGAHDAEIEIAAEATAADLLAELDLPGPVAIDGAPVEPADALLTAGLRSGAYVSVGASEGARERPALFELAVAGGLQGGERTALVGGSTVVGRGRQTGARLLSRTLSPRHCSITIRGGAVHVADLGSSNGTRAGERWLSAAQPVREGEVLSAGAVRLKIERRGESGGLLRPTDPEGTEALERPPRSLPGPDQPPLRVPPTPEPAPGHSPFSWATLVTPLVAGAALGILVSPTLAWLALLSPLMLAGSWWEQRHRDRGRRRRERSDYLESLDRLDASLSARRRAEVDALARAGPDPAVVTTLASRHPERLWARRPHHSDFLLLRLGTGDLPWSPPLRDLPAPEEQAPELAQLLERHRVLAGSPALADLRADRVLGVVGPPPVSAAVLRWIACQAAAHHGPADLRIVVLAEDQAAWRWARWLPHHLDGFEVVVCDQESDGEIARSLGPEEHLLVVADLPRPLSNGSIARRLLDGLEERISVLVRAAHHLELPEQCRLVLSCDADGIATLSSPDGRPELSGLIADGLPEHVAERCARGLARWRDPETCSGGGLPAEVALAPLLGALHLTPRQLAERWDQSDGRPVAVLGATTGASASAGASAGAGGSFEVDLAADGPHGLVGGTTGSGKSELLRTIVVSLALRCPASDLNFVLVDYKGGSAFDACASLPHVAGVVTDLDAEMGSRLLRGLEAEVRRREQALRRSGAQDLDHHRLIAGAQHAAIPRLVVVIDEFATLARELPDFLDALVSVAQRGRSLGIHLLLATQRPAGVVSDAIRTNTNLRIALRVLDRADSVDILDCGDAAQLRADRPGRALVKRGPEPPVPVQVARCAPPASSARTRPVRVRRLEHPGSDAQPPGSEMLRLVELARAASALRGDAEPAPPWTEPLPLSLAFDSRPEPPAAGQVVIGRADDPDGGTQPPGTWSPGEGHLVLVGMAGSGVTTALRTITCALAADRDCSAHAYLVGSRRELGDLEALGAVGAVIEPDEPERLCRLLDLVASAVEGRRRAEPPAADRLLLGIDGITRFLDAITEAGGLPAVDRFLRLATESASVGVHLVIAADRLAAVPGPLAASARQRLLFRLPESFDYSAAGARPTDPARLPPGRCVDSYSGLEVQVAMPPPEVAGVLACGRRAAEPPDPLRVLPAQVRLADLPRPRAEERQPRRQDPRRQGPSQHAAVPIVLGLRDRDHEPALLPLGPGDHMLVTGPPRSGKSTALAAFANQARHCGVEVLATGPARSALGGVAGGCWRWVDLDAAASEAQALAGERRSWMLLVDDAHLVADEAGTLAGMIEALGGGSVVAAAESEALRCGYRHWTYGLRSARFGLALHPTAAEAEIWAIQLPRVVLPAPPGRGVLIDRNVTTQIQVALP